MTPPTPHNSTTLVLRRTFPASRQRVFRAWLESKALEAWFKPRGMSITVSILEAYVGGPFRFDLENGDCIFGTYLHIAPPEKLVFTWSGNAIQGKETIVTLDFLERDSATEVVLTQEWLDAPELRQLFEAGWRPILSALVEVLSTHLDS